MERETDRALRDYCACVHAGEDAFSQSVVGLGCGAKGKVTRVAQELKLDRIRDKKEHMELEEKWGEMRKSSFLLDMCRTTLFYIPQKSISSTRTSPRDGAAEHIYRHTPLRSP